MPDDVSSKIEDFFARYSTRKYPKGQVLILEGERPDYIYHILEGRVKQYDVTYRGDEIILNIFKPPAFFPMSLALTGMDNHYVYEADTDIVLCQAQTEDVLQFLRSNPDVLYDLLRRVYIGADVLLKRMSYLMGGSAKSRLIYEIIVEARRFGTKSSDGGCTIGINEKDLGSRAGLSRETVSREIAKLKKDDLIEVRIKGIHIKKMTALEEKLGHEI